MEDHVDSVSDYVSSLEVRYDHKFFELVEIRKIITGCVDSYSIAGTWYNRDGCEEAIVGLGWLDPNGDVHEAIFDQESQDSFYVNKTKGQWSSLRTLKN